MTDPKRRHELLTDDGFQVVTIGEARQIVEQLHESQAKLYDAHRAYDHVCKCEDCQQHLENVRLAKESEP